MSSVDRAVKRRAGVVGDILNILGGPSYQQAVEEMLSAALELLQTCPAAKTERLERAIGALQGATLTKSEGAAFRVSTYMDAYRREVAGGVPEAAAHDAAVRNVLTTLPMAMNIALDKLSAMEAQLARIEAQTAQTNEAGK